MLPPPATVDPKLLSGYQAVAQVIGMCRQLPAGSPPSRAVRSAWLTKIQNQSLAARRVLEQAR